MYHLLIAQLQTFDDGVVSRIACATSSNDILPSISFWERQFNHGIQAEVQKRCRWFELIISMVVGGLIAWSVLSVLVSDPIYSSKILNTHPGGAGYSRKGFLTTEVCSNMA